MHSTASGASATFHPSALGGRPAVTSWSAQNIGGSSTKMPARPVICTMMSEKIAPGAPIRLRATLPVARARMGSSAVQLTRLAAVAAQPSSTTKPSSLKSHPSSQTLTEAGSRGAEYSA